jgi:type II secretory pathway pseudopilin PulG
VCRRLVPTILLVLACGTLAGAAAPVASALTRDAQMKQNLRLLQVYIERSAAAKSFVYPAAAAVRKGGGLTAPVWPANPWTGASMAPGKARGTYAYKVVAGGSGYTLVGHLSAGSFTLAGGTPAWLEQERLASGDVRTARDQAAESGARLIKSYIEQYGLQNNATAPSAGDVSETGGVGRLFAFWPANPFTGQPMASGTEPGDFAYSAGAGGAYSLSARTSQTAPLVLDGAIPQQLKNALTAARNAVTNASIHVIQQGVERYARDHNDAFPPDASPATLGTYVDPWPANPWTGVPMSTDSSAQGDCTYSQSPFAYTITAHLAGGVQGEIVDDWWFDRWLGIRDNLKDASVQSHGQVLKEYIDEWKAAHAGAAPTVQQMTKDGAVGALHVWWPVNPWQAVTPMENSSATGDFQYAPGAGGTYTLTVRQQVTDAFTQEHYTPE